MRDILGAWLSILCVLHCTLPILLLSFGASFGMGQLLESFHNDWLHLILILPIVAILAISIPKAYLSHRNPLPAYLAVIGVVTLIAGVVAGHGIETIFTVIGSAMVISAHFINRKNLKERVAAMASNA
jgi:hypothetical protein